MFLTLAWLVLAAQEGDEWQHQEAKYLKNVRPVTRDFVRAGEGYFSPDGKTIIFQAEEKGTGNPFYQIFTMDLASGSYCRGSPGVGRTTCSDLSPAGPKSIFATTHLEPDTS